MIHLCLCPTIGSGLTGSSSNHKLATSQAHTPDQVIWRISVLFIRWDAPPTRLTRRGGTKEARLPCFLAMVGSKQASAFTAQQANVLHEVWPNSLVLVL